MSVEWKSFVLPERSSLDPAHGLVAFLRASRGYPVRLQAHAVRGVDTLLLQVLLAAARTWKRQALDFVVTGVGARLDADLVRIGLTHDHLTWQGEGA